MRWSNDQETSNSGRNVTAAVIGLASGRISSWRAPETSLWVHGHLLQSCHTQPQTAIFQGPLHFQYLRRLTPVSELNTCITVGRSRPRSRRSRPTWCLAPGRVAMARPADDGPRFHPADRDAGASGAVPALVSKGTTQDAIAPSAQARSASRPPILLQVLKT